MDEDDVGYFDLLLFLGMVLAVTAAICIWKLPATLFRVIESELSKDDHDQAHMLVLPLLIAVGYWLLQG